MSNPSILLASSTSFTTRAAAPRFRPTWPDALRAIGGISLALGASVLAGTPGASGAELPAAIIAFVALTLGSALIGVAWLALDRFGEGSRVAAVVSFTLPVAMFAMALSGGATSSVVLVGLALAGFALGHIFVRAHPAVRVSASLVGAVILAAICAAFRRRGVPDGFGAVVDFALAVVGATIAMSPAPTVAVEE